MYVYTVCTWFPWKSEGIESPGTGVTDSCELPEGCWETNLGPGSSARAARVLTCQAISQAQILTPVNSGINLQMRTLLREN